MRFVYKIMFGLLAVFAGICVTGIPRVPDVDSESYRLMAAGRMHEVVRPYANRVLHPLLVQGLKGVNPACWRDGCSPGEDWAFWAVAVFSVIAAVAAVSCLTPSLSPLQTAALVATPFVCLYAVNIYLQDLLVIALTALFLVALLKERLVLALVLLFLLQTARESTYLVTGCLLAVAVWRRRWTWAAGTCLAAVCATVVVSWVSRQARPNIHEMNGLVYLATKVVANGAENLLGLTVWSDSYARQLPHFYPGDPLWKTALPAWIPFGSMREAGIYRVDLYKPLELLVCAMTAFGVLPLLALGTFRRLFRRLLEQPLAIAVAAATGLIFLALTPFGGKTVARYVGYAWPLFWYALPAAGRADVSAGTGRGFWIAHVACMWWPVLLTRAGLPRGWVIVLAMAGVAACYSLARASWKGTSAAAAHA